MTGLQVLGLVLLAAGIIVGIIAAGKDRADRTSQQAPSTAQDGQQAPNPYPSKGQAKNGRIPSLERHQEDQDR